jgi:hypothetical protein
MTEAITTYYKPEKTWQQRALEPDPNQPIWDNAQQTSNQTSTSLTSVNIGDFVNTGSTVSSGTAIEFVNPFSTVEGCTAHLIINGIDVGFGSYTRTSLENLGIDITQGAEVKVRFGPKAKTTGQWSDPAAPTSKPYSTTRTVQDVEFAVSSSEITLGTLRKTLGTNMSFNRESSNTDVELTRIITNRSQTTTEYEEERIGDWEPVPGNVQAPGAELRETGNFIKCDKDDSDMDPSRTETIPQNWDGTSYETISEADFNNLSEAEKKTVEIDEDSNNPVWDGISYRETDNENEANTLRSALPTSLQGECKERPAEEWTENYTGSYKKCETKEEYDAFLAAGGQGGKVEKKEVPVETGEYKEISEEEARRLESEGLVVEQYTYNKTIEVPVTEKEDKERHHGSASMELAADILRKTLYSINAEHNFLVRGVVGAGVDIDNTSTSLEVIRLDTQEIVENTSNENFNLTALGIGSVEFTYGYNNNDNGFFAGFGLGLSGEFGLGLPGSYPVLGFGAEANAVIGWNFQNEILNRFSFNASGQIRSFGDDWTAEYGGGVALELLKKITLDFGVGHRIQSDRIFGDSSTPMLNVGLGLNLSKYFRLHGGVNSELFIATDQPGSVRGFFGVEITIPTGPEKTARK